VVKRALLLTALIATSCTASEPQAADPVPSAQASGTLFVANKRGDSLSMIDLSSGVEVKRVDSCTNPHELAISPDGAHVALACYAGQTIAIFNTVDLLPVAEIDLGEGARPHGILWPANDVLYSTAEGRQSIFRVDNPLGEAEISEFATGKRGSHMLAVSPDGNNAWTTDLGSKTVTSIDLTREKAPLSVEVGIEPEGISLAPDGSALWVSARGSDMAFELDPQTMEIRRSVATGRFPLRILIRPQGDYAATSNLADGGLSIIDIESGELVRSIAVSSAEQAEKRQQVTISWSADGRLIYVAETGTDTIAEIDFESGQLIRRFNVGEGGDGLAVLE
jgi:DNA-binding beta-propeller fold protein YncE